MIAAAMVSVAWTRIAGTMLGRMWRRAMRQGGLPTARAASTNSSAATACTCARVSRTKIEVAERPIATMALVEARAQEGGERDGQDQERDRQQRVGEAHDRPVDPAARVAGEQPEGQAEGDGQRHRDQARPERRAGAEDDAREHVAADLVGAERMREARGGADGAPVGGGGIVGGDPGGEGRHQQSRPTMTSPATALRRARRRRQKARGCRAPGEWQGRGGRTGRPPGCQSRRRRSRRGRSRCRCSCPPQLRVDEPRRAGRPRG